jgi:WD40 repeat protein
MGRASVAALLIAGACGFHLPAPGGGSDDTAPDASGNNGDSGSSATCLERWLAHDLSFTNIHRIDEVSSAEVDRDPYLTRDQLTLFLSSGRDSSSDVNIYVASRPTPTDAFAAPALATGSLNSTAEDGRLTLTADGLTAVIASARTGSSGGMGLFLGVRRFTTDDFTVMTTAPFVQLAADAKFDPELTGDGAHLYFAPPGGASQHIVMATRSGQAYDPPIDVPGINDDLQNADPSLSPDERIIVFSSTRPAASGSFDLYYATRDTATGTFETPIRLDTLDSSGNDSDPVLSSDGCHLFFSSDRQGNNFDIYTADIAP